MWTSQLIAGLQKAEQTQILASLANSDLSAAQTLPLLTRLRKTYAPELAAALLETARLRQRGRLKFARANQMLFTSEALQQATPEDLAAYHAALLAEFDTVADLGCSIGGDACLIGQKTQVIGLDQDPIRLIIARHNGQVYKANADFIQADLTTPLPFSKKVQAAFFDPARRSEKERIFSVKDYLPPLEYIHRWGFEGMLIKVSPGVDVSELADFNVGIAFVSQNGDLKEALLHYGDLAFEGKKAVIFPSRETLTDQVLALPPITETPRAYLYEPDPALIRAGLFGELCDHLNLAAFRLDPDIAYLTSDTLVLSDWVRVWRVDDWMPFHLKKLRALLKTKGVGAVTVKKRGSPLTPEGLQASLKLKKGDNHAILILTRLGGQHVVLIHYGDQPISVMNSSGNAAES